jgi:hypothetical protein
MKLDEQEWGDNIPTKMTKERKRLKKAAWNHEFDLLMLRTVGYVPKVDRQSWMIPFTFIQSEPTDGNNDHRGRALTMFSALNANLNDREQKRLLELASWFRCYFYWGSV